MRAATASGISCASGCPCSFSYGRCCPGCWQPASAPAHNAVVSGSDPGSEVEELLTRSGEYARIVLEWLNRPAIIVQAAIILTLFGVAWALTWWAEPRLRQQARRIRKMPGVLRLVVILLRRL